jgi:RNA polymerase sigma-70 factor (ECF subfamily)
MGRQARWFAERWMVGGTDDPHEVRSAMGRYERPLLAYALRLVGGDVERARDVVQETFARLCDRPPADVNGHLPQWLYTVCRNAAMDVRRKARREMALVETADETIASPASTPDEVAEASDTTSHVLKLLSRLPADQQEVIRLKFQHQMSYRQIANITGHSETNVGFLIHRGIKRIREMLS